MGNINIKDVRRMEREWGIEDVKVYIGLVKFSICDPYNCSEWSNGPRKNDSLSSVTYTSVIVARILFCLRTPPSL